MELAACREFFHCCLSRLNSVTLRASESMLGMLLPSSRQDWVWWPAFGLEPCPGHRLGITCPRPFWGKNVHLVGGFFFGLGGVDWRGQRIFPQYRLGLCCQMPKAFRGRKVPTSVSLGRGKSST